MFKKKCLNVFQKMESRTVFTRPITQTIRILKNDPNCSTLRIKTAHVAIRLCFTKDEIETYSLLDARLTETEYQKYANFIFKNVPTLKQIEEICLQRLVCAEKIHRKYIHEN